MRPNHGILMSRLLSGLDLGGSATVSYDTESGCFTRLDAALRTSKFALAVLVTLPGLFS